MVVLTAAAANACGVDACVLGGRSDWVSLQCGFGIRMLCVCIIEFVRNVSGEGWSWSEKGLVSVHWQPIQANGGSVRGGCVVRSVGTWTQGGEASVHGAVDLSGLGLMCSGCA